MIYAEMLNSALGKAEFTLEREVARRECLRGNSAQLERKDHKPSFGATTRSVAWFSN